MIYVITGHLGGGKTLLSVELARQYLVAGKRVASNITLNLEYLVPADNEARWIKLPYIPTADHLRQLGDGYDGPYDEERFGLIVLDEAGTWLNSRDWNDKGRRELFHWLTHARKKGWDIALIIQDFESLDAQIRRSITEIYVDCSRLDRVKIPYLPVRLPRIHRATAYYKSPLGQVYKRWHTSGTDLFKAFDTREAIGEELLFTETATIDARGSWSGLPARLLVGRYMPPPQGRGFLAIAAAKLVWFYLWWTAVNAPAARRVAGAGIAVRDWWQLQLMRAFPKAYPSAVRECAANGYRLGSSEHERTMSPARARVSRLVADDVCAYRLDKKNPAGAG